MQLLQTVCIIWFVDLWSLLYQLFEKVTHRVGGITCPLYKLVPFQNHSMLPRSLLSIPYHTPVVVAFRRESW
jgi:hypothetical protein